MEELRGKLAEVLSDRLYQIIISNPRSKTDILKIKVRPVMVKGEVVFQETLWKGPQVFHKNRTKEEMLEKIAGYMEADFKQLEAWSMDGKMHVLVGKKGTVTIKDQKAKDTGTDRMPDMSHNRTKRYILEEGRAVPFLADLGVQTKEGKIVHARYDKFKQINRYLEFVEDVLPVLTREGTCSIF